MKFRHHVFVAGLAGCCLLSVAVAAQKFDASASEQLSVSDGFQFVPPADERSIPPAQSQPAAVTPVPSSGTVQGDAGSQFVGNQIGQRQTTRYRPATPQSDLPLPGPASSLNQPSFSQPSFGEPPFGQPSSLAGGLQNGAMGGLSLIHI